MAILSKGCNDACDFFRFLPMNNALSSSRTDARETVSSNDALEKENFDDWYYGI